MLESISNRKSRKSKNDTPPIVFASFSCSKRCRKAQKISKNQLRDAYKNLLIFLTDFEAIFARFSTHDPKISKSQPKSHAKSKQKNHFKMTPKIAILASKTDCFFLTFLATKIDPWRRLGPIRAPKQKITSQINQKTSKL